jgi:hypothetical protein
MVPIGTLSLIKEGRFYVIVGQKSKPRVFNSSAFCSAEKWRMAARFQRRAFCFVGGVKYKMRF